MTSSSHPPAFDGTDYPYWKARMSAFLKGKGIAIWNITIDTTYVIPADPSNAAHATKYENNNKAVDFLFAALSKSEFDRVSDKQVAHEIWSTLQNFHEGTNAVKIRLFETYRREYDNFMQSPGESIKNLFAQFLSLVNKMKANITVMPYDDHARALKLLHALDLDVWGTKVEAIVESTNYETLTTDELFSKLKSKEIDIQFRKKLNNPTTGSSSNIPMALVSGSTNTNANLSSTPSFALSSLCHIADDELEVFDDDQLVLLTNKFKRVYENRRNRRRSEGCFNCGERGHFIADCPSKVKAPEHGNSYRRQEQSRDRKNKSDRRGRKKGQQKFTDKQIKKAAHVLFSSLGSFDSDASYNSSDSESEDEKPKKTNDGGLCFLADIKGGMCTMALNEGDAYDCSNDSSDNEVQNSAEEEIEELTKLVDKQNKILARLKADHDRISAELKTLKDATPAAVECEECSIHMVSISELQSKHAVLVDKFDCAKIELEELRSRSVLLGACATCPILQTELNVAKCHIVQLEKHTCPVLPECLTCPTFVAEISILKKDNAALEEENTHLRTILGWCSVREPQIGMTIAQIKRGEHFGVGYDLKRTFGKKNAGGENNGPTPSEKSPPVSSEGFVVEPPKSVPKKQVWRVKPKHFKSLNNTWPPTCEHLDNLKPDFSGSTSKAKVVVAPTQNIYHCDFCDRDGHLAEFCFRRKHAERRDRYPAHGAYDRSDSRRASVVRFSGFRSRNSAPASYRNDMPRFPPRGHRRSFERFDFANASFEQMAQHWFSLHYPNPSVESLAHSRVRY